MSPTQPAPEFRAAIPVLTQGITGTLAALVAIIARVLLRHPRHAVHILPLCIYIQRTSARFARVLARLAAGRLRPAASQPGRAGRRGGPPPLRAFPRTRAWLLAELRHEGAWAGIRITAILEQPEAAAVIAAAPQAARLLRPLCHMLGIAPAALVRPALPVRPASERPRPQRPDRSRPSPSDEVSALGPRPVQPLCPRLLHRWPFNQRPPPRPA